MKKARAEKADAKVSRPMSREELRLITGGTTAESAGGGLLAFPFIQSAM